MIKISNHLSIKIIFLICFLFLLFFPSCVSKNGSGTGIIKSDWVEVPVEREKPIVLDPNKKDQKLNFTNSDIKCVTKEIILRNQEGIILSIGKRIQKNYINKSDIYFKDDRFITDEMRGKIISVGNMGTMSLCDVNYPEFNAEYKNNAKIVKDHVYMYVSLDGNIRAEIRIKSYHKSKQIKFSYHVRTD